MNKIQKIVCLIGIMILPIDSAIAAPYGGMGEIVIFAFLLFAFIYFILMPYLAKRLISWIYGIILFIVKREWRTWNVRLLILDIPMLGIAFYLLNIMYFEPQKKQKSENLLYNSAELPYPNHKPLQVLRCQQEQLLKHILITTKSSLNLKNFHTLNFRKQLCGIIFRLRA